MGPALVVGALVAAANGLGWLVRERPIYSARWADRNDVAPLVLRVRPGHEARPSIPLVLAHGRVVGLKPSPARPELGHVVACAPSRSGKGLWLTYALLTWPASAVVLDPKGELFRLTAGYRARFTRVLALDPAGRGHRYDPFGELAYSPEALKTAALLVLRPEQDKENAIFAQRAAMLLAALLRAAYLLRLPTLPAVRAMIDLGPERLVSFLHQRQDTLVSHWFAGFLLRDPGTFEAGLLAQDRFLASSWGTLTTRLEPLLSDGVLKMSSASDFRAEELFERPTTVYLTFHEAELEHTQAALRLVLLAVVTALLRVADRQGGQVRRPLLLALDEAERVPVPRLPDFVSTVAGRGISVLTVVQSLAQIQDAYGASGAHTILANAFAQLHWSTHDLRTSEDLSRLLGQQTVEETRHSRRVVTLTPDPIRMTTARPRELLTPDEFRQIPKDHVLAIVGEYPPVLGRRLDWREVPWMVRLTQIPPPSLPLIERPAIPPLAPRTPDERKAQALPASSGTDALAIDADLPG